MKIRTDLDIMKIKILIFNKGENIEEVVVEFNKNWEIKDIQGKNKENMRVKIIMVVIEAGAIAKNVSSHHNKIIIQLLSKKKDSKTIHQGYDLS